ncbi:MAG: YiiD C-terminal domain-containing protein [Steroidobacteraceae bacterium]|jgi:thioesterase domain-containing protein
MSPQSLEQYLHQQIPLSRAMQVSAVDVTEESVQLSAPLAPNLNHRATVFGGSASALAILAAWSLLHVRLRASFPSVSIVIQRQSMSYSRPIHGTFVARAALVQPGEWPQFVRLLTRRGRARITVASTLDYAGEEVGHFTGDFVAFGRH